jgi:hypothetical protein
MLGPHPDRIQHPPRKKRPGRPRASIHRHPSVRSSVPCRCGGGAASQLAVIRRAQTPMPARARPRALFAGRSACPAERSHATMPLLRSLAIATDRSVADFHRSPTPCVCGVFCSHGRRGSHPTCEGRRPPAPAPARHPCISIRPYPPCARARAEPTARPHRARRDGQAPRPDETTARGCMARVAVSTRQPPGSPAPWRATPCLARRRRPLPIQGHLHRHTHGLSPPPKLERCDRNPTCESSTHTRRVQRITVVSGVAAAATVRDPARWTAPHRQIPRLSSSPSELFAPSLLFGGRKFRVERVSCTGTKTMATSQSRSGAGGDSTAPCPSDRATPAGWHANSDPRPVPVSSSA